MEGGDSEFAKFTLLTLNAFLKAHSPNLAGNKQQLVARAIGYPKPVFLSLTNSRLFGQPKSDVKTLFFHLPSPFPCNICNCNSGSICTASLFWVKLLLLYRAWTNAYSEIGPEVTAATFRDVLRKRLRRAFTRANQLYWTAQYIYTCIGPWPRQALRRRADNFYLVLATLFLHSVLGHLCIRPGWQEQPMSLAGSGLEAISVPDKVEAWETCRSDGPGLRCWSLTSSFPPASQHHASPGRHCFFPCPPLNIKSHPAHPT